MDTRNLTSAPPAVYKTRPEADADHLTRGKGLSPSLSEAAATVEQPPVKQSVDVPADEKTQSLVQDALRKLNDLAQTSVAFTQHEETGRTVITVSDKTTGEEIRTIPSEDFLAISAHLEESLASAEGLQPGLLVSNQA